MDYGKHKYTLARRDREARKRQKATEVRLLRLNPHIGEHDLQVKLRKLRELLGEGNKVRLNLRFRGAWIRHPELGHQLFERIVKEVSDIANPEGTTRREGRMMNLLLSPKPGLKPPPKETTEGKGEKEREEKPRAAAEQPAAPPKPEAPEKKEDVKQEPIPKQVLQAADPEDSGEAG